MDMSMQYLGNVRRQGKIALYSDDHVPLVCSTRLVPSYLTTSSFEAPMVHKRGMIILLYLGSLFEINTIGLPASS